MNMKILRRAIQILAVVLVTNEPVTAEAVEGILLYASFNESASPDQFAGRMPEDGIRNSGKQIDGVIGKAWSGRLTYRAAGNVNAERGTVAFFARNPYLQLQSREWGFYHWMVVLMAEGESIRPWVLDLGGRARGARFNAATVDLSQWHHYAITWDRNFGTRFYVDGKLASQDWADDRGWANLLTPHAVTLRAKQGIDELYIFDWALGAGGVQSLKEGKAPERPEGAHEHASRVKAELGYDTAGADVVAADRPLLVERIAIKDTKSRTVTMTWVHDGRHHAAWPDVYTGDHKVLDIFPTEASFNYVTLEGRLPGVRLSSWDHITETTSPILRVPAGQATWFGKRVREQTARRLKLARPGSQTGETANNAIQEIALFRVSEEDIDVSVESKTFFPSGRATFESLGAVGSDLLDCGRLKSNPPVLLDAPEAKAKPITIPMPGRVDLVGPLQKERLYANGVHLDLELQSPHDSDVVDVVVYEAIDGFREMIRFPVKVTFQKLSRSASATQTGKAKLKLALVRKGFIVDEGERFRMSLTSFRGGLTIDSKSKFTVIVGDPEQVLPETIEDLYRVTHKMFSWAQEGRPWGRDFEKQFLAGRYGKFSTLELSRLLKKLLRLAPDHFEARATFAEINKKPLVEERLSPEIPEGVPDWAYYAREVLRANLRITHWWHDKRLMQDGQLGGGWNDDPCLTAYQSLGASISDPDTLALIQKVADGYVKNSGQYRDGFNVIVTDPLHSSDPTAGRCNLLTFDYGSARNVLRSMECCRNLKTWIPKNANGTRSLVGHNMAAGVAKDSPWAGSYVHAIYSDPIAWAWYSGDPKVKQMMLDVADTWLAGGLEYWKKFPEQRNISIIVNGRTGEWKPGGTSGQSFREQFFHSAFVLSGDRRYLIPIERRKILPSLYYRETPVKEWGRSYKREADAIIARANSNRSSIRYEYRYDGIFALACVETGDTKYVSEGLKLAHEELQAGQEYLNSSAEKPTDRVFPCVGSNLLGEMFCGGYLPDSRTALVGSLWATWDGTGDQVIPFVTKQAPTEMSISLFNFAKNKKHIGLRVWRLARGNYQLQVGPDLNGDGQQDSVQFTLSAEDVRRGSMIRFDLSPGLSVLRLKQAKALPKLGRLPDLAVDESFIRYNPLKDSLEVKVYNLGSADAKGVRVRVYAEDRLLREVDAEKLAWPSDFHPQPLVLSYPQAATLDTKTIRVEVKTEGDEITLENNHAVVAWPQD